jgi:SAM-dependent methyltransferase
MKLSDLPFDTARRFAVILEFTRRLGLPPRASVLDVGGHPGTLATLLRQQSPDWNVHTVDSIPDDLAHYTRADGARLPFGDATFDLVVTSDVLEHVIPADRTRFLAELGRVSRDAVLVGAPFFHPASREIEHQLNACSEALTGTRHPWLHEHLANGLPEVEATRAALSPGRTTSLLPAAPLDDWIAFQWGALARDLLQGFDAAWGAWNAARSALVARHPDRETAAWQPGTPLPFVPYRWFVLAVKTPRPDFASCDSAPTPELIPPAEGLVEASAFWRVMLESLARAATPASGDVSCEIDERLAKALSLAESENARLRTETREPGRRELLRRLLTGKS